MSQIYVSGPWSFASGVLQVVKSIKVKSRADKVVYSEKGTEYQFSKLEQSDYVVFVLDGFAWQQKKVFLRECFQNLCGVLITEFQCS